MSSIDIDAIDVGASSDNSSLDSSDSEVEVEVTQVVQQQQQQQRATATALRRRPFSSITGEGNEISRQGSMMCRSVVYWCVAADVLPLFVKCLVEILVGSKQLAWEVVLGEGRGWEMSPRRIVLLTTRRDRVQQCTAL